MTRVLVVDDEENIRFSFTKILTNVGYDVIKTADLTDARRILSSDQFDVAIIDRLLSPHNGMDLIKHINKIQPTCTTILMSAFPNFKSASEGLKHNLFAYLQKPIRKDKLCDIVAAAAQTCREKRKLKNLDLQLINCQRLGTVGMLASGIVHDFNNLFMSISGLAQLSALDMPLGNPSLKDLEQIQKLTDQGGKLSNQLLSYISKTNEEPVPVQVQSLLKKSLILLRMILPKTIEIKEQIDNVDDCILVYPTQIQQVIINLGINAMHAMGNKNGILYVNLQMVKVETKKMKALELDNKKCVKLTMEDTGCGMDSITLKQIFDPFFSTRPKGIGTGIGLSITSTIIKNHGGGITVESRVGKGSVFHVYLPLIVQ